jgi:S1-C subfamily serine protease
MSRAALIICFLSFCSFANSQPFKTQSSFKQYLLENIDKADYIEGIWEFSIKEESVWGLNNYNWPTHSKNIDHPTFKMAIMKSNGSQYISFPITAGDDFLGDGISDHNDTYYANFTFTSTASEGQYLFANSSNFIQDFSGCKGKAYINKDGDLYFECKKSEKSSFSNFYIVATKLSPTQTEIRNWKAKFGNEITKDKPTLSYGTGLAISSDLILTCYHVVKDGKQISVRGVNGKFDTTYSAQIIFFDEDLDIAFIKTPPQTIKINSSLPYTLKKEKSEVGESIFVLGYPLQNTMGQEIKLTTGVISSNSGFLGDTSLLQISAPIQPGNSGGPVFDNHRNLIGIVSAKHNRADNVGYAVKLSIFQNYLKLKGVNFSSNKTVPMELSKQIKLVRDYIYSIEVTFE